MTQAVAKTEERTDEATGMVAMIERLARAPDVDVQKLESLLAMQERIMARQAAQEYSESMNEAQRDLSIVSQDASNPQTKSKYASYAALDRAIRPVYTEHGFGLSFDTADGAPESCIRVVCRISHKGGHIETRHIDMPADGKGAKGGDVMTKTHATMSAVSYGRRALLKMIFNIAEGKDTDDDGNAAAGRQPITEDQAHELGLLLTKEKIPLDKFLKVFGIDALPNLPAASFEDAKKEIAIVVANRLKKTEPAA